MDKNPAQAKYVLKNPMKIWAMQTLNRHRAKYDVKIGWVKLVDIAQKTKSCRYCGFEFIWKRGEGHAGNRPSLDRVDNGHVLTENNIQIICRSCNARKNIRSNAYFVHRHESHKAYIAAREIARKSFKMQDISTPNNLKDILKESLARKVFLADLSKVKKGKKYVKIVFDFLGI
jgi:hypothetical protein